MAIDGLRVGQARPGLVRDAQMEAVRRDQNLARLEGVSLVCDFDVEGAETEVLRGARRLLTSAAPSSVASSAIG